LLGVHCGGSTMTKEAPVNMELDHNQSKMGFRDV
jgi:hypothetical protein